MNERADNPLLNQTEVDIGLSAGEAYREWRTQQSRAAEPLPLYPVSPAGLGEVAASLLQNEEIEMTAPPSGASVPPKTFVEFWSVGATVGGLLPMTTADISGHLLADWAPSLPPAVGSSFIGWPPFMIKPTDFNGNELLALADEARRSERQWKSVLSWMLGIAGARHVLAQEGYRWVAPLSAFYQSAVQVVDVAAWPFSFPPASLTTARRPGSGCRLCPDYIGLRSTASTRPPSDTPYDWAVAEAKGTRARLTARDVCPSSWAKQVRNVVLKVDGVEVDVPRYLVVATRVNANAKAARAHRIQVRAWNRARQPRQPRLPGEAAVDIASAHLFGLFRALQLPDNALAIGLSTQRRAELRRRQHLFETTEHDIEGVARRADDELRVRMERPAGPTELGASVALSLDTPFGPIGLDIAEPLVALSRKLRHLDDGTAGAAVLSEADSELDAWQSVRLPTAHERDVVALPFGVELHFPPHFWRRG